MQSELNSPAWSPSIVRAFKRIEEALKAHGIEWSEERCGNASSLVKEVVRLAKPGPLYVSLTAMRWEVSSHLAQTLTLKVGNVRTEAKNDHQPAKVNTSLVLTVGSRGWQVVHEFTPRERLEYLQKKLGLPIEVATGPLSDEEEELLDRYCSENYQRSGGMDLALHEVLVDISEADIFAIHLPALIQLFLSGGTES